MTTSACVDRELILPLRSDTKGADLVPSPSLEQAREFIRASKAENTFRG
jgi:hypothetical protein